MATSVASRVSNDVQTWGVSAAWACRCQSWPFGDPTRDGNRTMLFSGEIAEQRHLECVRAARAQGDRIGQHIATLELLPETSEDVQGARAGLEKLRREIERAAIAIARSGVGTTTVEETLDETVGPSSKR